MWHLKDMKQLVACCVLNAGFLLGLIFNPDDEGNMFL
jgi:hypothetical protein